MITQNQKTRRRTRIHYIHIYLSIYTDAKPALVFHLSNLLTEHFSLLSLSLFSLSLSYLLCGLFLKYPYKRFCFFIFFIFTHRDLSLSLIISDCGIVYIFCLLHKSVISNNMYYYLYLDDECGKGDAIKRCILI